MQAFSEQIRDAIKATKVSRYSLADQTGVSESVLSRFMTGKQSISLSTLDKIADVLGLQVTVGVSTARQKPKRTANRSNGVKSSMETVKTLTRDEWEQLAANAARDAQEENFSSRRGLYEVEGVGIVFYDNNPFSLPRETDPREDLISEIRAYLNRSELNEKASAYWPTSGEEQDYTFAMVIEAEGFMIEQIRNAFNSIVKDFMNRIERARTDD